MKKLKMLAICAISLGGGVTAFSAEAVRNLKWTYAGEAFSDPSNWAWVDTSITEEITEGPRETDRVFFEGSGESGYKTVRLTSDAVVSNFIYSVGSSKKGGALVDLNSHTLTVTNQLSLKSDSNVAEASPLIFSNGAVRVTGSALGTKIYGQPNEDAGGFFMNRLYDAYAAVNLIFDNASLTVTQSSYSVALKAKMANNTMSRVQLLNGAFWDLSTLMINNEDGGPINFTARASKLKLKGDLSLQCKAACDLVFEDGSTFEMGGALRSQQGGCLLLNGGTHSFGYSESYGDNGSCSLTGMDVVISNKAVLAAKSHLSIRSGSSISVCDGAQLTATGSAKIGHHANMRDDCFGDSTLLVDNGTVTVSDVQVGGYSAYSNNCLRIVGPLSRVETTGTDAGGAISFSYGAHIEFEIPAEGYHDAEGTARAPVYANTTFTSSTNNMSRPVALVLTTKAFDKKHPKESIVLMQSKETRRNVYGTSYDTQIEELTNNVVFVDSAKNPGTITISEDKKSLIYTAPIPVGMLISVR